MKIQGEKPSKVVLWQFSRYIINNCKEFLILLEELKAENVISEEYYNKLRSRLLGSSNDKIREAEEFLSMYDIRERTTLD